MNKTLISIHRLFCKNKFDGSVHVVTRSGIVADSGVRVHVGVQVRVGVRVVVIGLAGV